MFETGLNCVRSNECTRIWRFREPNFRCGKCANSSLLNVLETSKGAWKVEGQINSFQVLPCKPANFNLQPVNYTLRYKRSLLYVTLSHRLSVNNLCCTESFISWLAITTRQNKVFIQYSLHLPGLIVRRQLAKKLFSLNILSRSRQHSLKSSSCHPD